MSSPIGLQYNTEELHRTGSYSQGRRGRLLRGTELTRSAKDALH